MPRPGRVRKDTGRLSFRPARHVLAVRRRGVVYRYSHQCPMKSSGAASREIGKGQRAVQGLCRDEDVCQPAA